MAAAWCHYGLSRELALIGLEDHVLDVELEAGTDGSGRPDAELAIDDLGAGSGSLLGKGIAKIVGKAFVVAVTDQVDASDDQGGEKDGAEQTSSVMIGLIGDSSVAGFVGTDHNLELKTVAVGQDEPVPDDLGAAAAWM